MLRDGRAPGGDGRPALLAQLVEHFHGKEGVNGSSPLEGFAVFGLSVPPPANRYCLRIVDALVTDALFGTAAEMQTLAYEVGIERTYEADLQAALRRSLQLGAGRHGIGEPPSLGVVEPQSALALASFRKWARQTLACETTWPGRPTRRSLNSNGAKTRPA